MSSRSLLQSSQLYSVLNKLLLTVCGRNSSGYITLKGEASSLLVCGRSDKRLFEDVGATPAQTFDLFVDFFCICFPNLSFSLLQNKTQVTFGGLTAPSVFKTGGFVSTKGVVLNSLRIYKPFLIFLESCPRRH